MCAVGVECGDGVWHFTLEDAEIYQATLSAVKHTTSSPLLLSSLLFCAVGMKPTLASMPAGT